MPSRRTKLSDWKSQRILELFVGEVMARTAAGKVAVFGILKRAGKVYTVVPDDLKAKTLMPIIKDKVVPDSIVYTDGFKS